MDDPRDDSAEPARFRRGGSRRDRAAPRGLARRANGGGCASPSSPASPSRAPTSCCDSAAELAARHGPSDPHPREREPRRVRPRPAPLGSREHRVPGRRGPAHGPHLRRPRGPYRTRRTGSCLAARGSAVAHCPTSNLRLASGRLSRPRAAPPRECASHSAPTARPATTARPLPGNAAGRAFFRRLARGPAARGVSTKERYGHLGRARERSACGRKVSRRAGARTS